MSEHSKGPWTYDAKTGKIRDANGVAIADDLAFGGPAETPTTVNMLLMAAAPELVEALRMQRCPQSTACTPDEPDDVVCGACRAKRAALKKAGVEP